MSGAACPGHGRTGAASRRPGQQGRRPDSVRNGGSRLRLTTLSDASRPRPPANRFIIGSSPRREQALHLIGIVAGRAVEGDILDCVDQVVLERAQGETPSPVSSTATIAEVQQCGRSLNGGFREWRRWPIMSDSGWGADWPL